ncbi:ribonuclease P protein component [Candidatus Uhrbacteria bacterium]|jgi:ribonuclease P protein component|nr:ribonuclease P protein component [Candidatus Uhrbacteria bacterium]
MFPSEHRLKQEKDIKTLFAKGKGVFGIYVSLKFRKNNLEVSRFTAVAGLKVSKKAVVRNRLKRQVRAIVEKQIESIPAGYDIALLIRKEAVGKTSAELELQIIKSFQKAKLLKV